MARHLETLVELQEVLVQLADARSRHSQVPEAVAVLQAQDEDLAQRIAALEETAEEADREKRAAEGSSQEAKEKAEHYEAQIPRVTTQKEYGALLSEIDAAKQAREAAEESALASIELADTSRKEVETLASERQELSEQLSGGVKEWEAARPELEQQIDQLEARSAALKEQLPPQIANLFERLLERHQGEPLARIVEIERPKGKMWRCEACNYSVRPQVVMQVRSGNDVVLCDTCQRVFFFDEPA